MCGIASVYAYHYAAPAVDKDELRVIRDAMLRRGPDGCGEWYSSDGRVGLAHRRLAIIDTSQKGAQPMASADGNLVITFNGEIYNYRELRLQLESGGAIFRSDSDTEILLHLYAAKGESMLDELRGMFAFILWDAKKNALWMVRDPYGIKPLYYANDGWSIRAASQVKALLASRRVSRLPEPAGEAGFLLFGYVPEPFTTFQEIRSLPAGSFIWVDETGPREPKRYFSVAKILRNASSKPQIVNDQQFKSILHDALCESLRYHFVADVPVAVFLSAGIDSGALVAFAESAGISNISTLTLSFSEFLNSPDDETPLAKKVSERYGTRHIAGTMSVESMRGELPQILDAMDQPTIDGINTYIISKMCSQNGFKVALSGLGGDELFGGYPSFRNVPAWAPLSSIISNIPLTGSAIRRVLQKISKHRLSPKISSLFEYGGYDGAYLLQRGLFLPWELPELMGEDAASAGLERLGAMKIIGEAYDREPLSNSFAMMSCLESSLYMKNQLLRDADWAGMAHSLEIRVPFVDAQLLRRLAPYLVARPGSKKRLLAASPRKPLPETVTNRPKTGFAIPMDSWLQSIDSLQSWRRVPRLSSKGSSPWRRWAYTLYERGRK